jgi:hypothetical protein
MDYKNWCKLCGSVDAILKPDNDQEDVINKLIEVKLIFKFFPQILKSWNFFIDKS